MALSPQLAEFDGLIDLVVEQLVREIQDPQIKTPPGTRPPDGANLLTTRSPNYPDQGATDVRESTRKAKHKQTHRTETAP
jgi:hypothetical protein